MELVYTRAREMIAKEIFGVAVRFIGLLFLYQSLSAVPTAITNICPVFPHFYWKNVVPSLIMVGWPMLIAHWLIRGAPLVMRLAYREEAGRTDAEAQGSKSG